MLDSFWVVLLLPLVGSFVNGIFGKRLPRRFIGTLACTTVFLSFLVSLLTLVQIQQYAPDSRVITVHIYRWIEAGDFAADFALLIDPLSLLMMLVVTGVGFLIHVYSMGYMAQENGYYRFFSYMNLFILMMSILVLANNYLLMFVGWEGVGLCSYLLIGYYFEKKSAGDAAKKAFIVNRIGDFGFALGIFLIFKTFGSTEYGTVFEKAAALSPESWGVLGIIAFLLFIGAVGKSAQIPLYVWLPDAMEGPTPVSALIHAATMVTAGVYMIARSSAIYSRAPEIMTVVAVVGLATAVLAALIAIAQTDIKRVLAYSTVSQLGYMFLAVGIGAFGTGIFHLMTHAFFKALLFLGSGSVILAMHHQQDMLKMGGLKKYLPRTYWSMLIATAAIAGVPFLSGFFSKDEILWNAFSSPHGGFPFWLAGVLVAGLTAFYMFRLIFLTFHGQERLEFAHESHPDEYSSEGDRKPREPASLVTFPLMILAFFSLVAGYVGPPAWTGYSNQLEHYLDPSFRLALEEPASHHAPSEEILLMIVTILIAGVGIVVAYVAYIRNPDLPRVAASRFRWTHEVLKGKFFVDELYDMLFVRPIGRISREFLWKAVDTGVIDGAVNGTGTLVQKWGSLLRLLQGGHARSYAAWILGGSFLILAYYLL